MCFLGGFGFLEKQEMVPDVALHGINGSIDVGNKMDVQGNKREQMTSLYAGGF